MTIQDIGSLGELIGAIATIATLAYLALQIRANTRVAKAESRRNNYSGVADALAPIVADEAVALIFLRGLDDYKSLDRVERMRFSFAIGRLAAGAQLAYYEHADGVSGESASQHVDNVVLFLHTAGGHEWWLRNRGNYRHAFRERVDELLAEAMRGSGVD